MEGLLFESSTTTPYHFINQAELSAGPSNPEVGLPYGPLDVTLGVQHLQLLGVKYFVAETPAVEQQANADPDLTLVASTGPWTSDYNGVASHTTWKVYRVKDSPLVTPLRNDPVVLSGVTPSPSSWLGTAAHEGPALAWYTDPSTWDVELAQSGPADWPRTPVGHVTPTVKHVGTTTVTAVHQSDSTVSFHVSRVGHPRPGQGVVLPELARQRGRGSVAGHAQPHGRRTDEPRRDAQLRHVERRTCWGWRPRVAGVVALVVLFVVPAVRRWRLRPNA